MKYKIRDLCDTISATFDKTKEKVVLINTSDVLEGNVLNHELVINENIKGQFKKTFQTNDILYSEIRPKNKRFAFVDFESEDYVASTKLMVLRANKKILPEFLFQLLKSDLIIQQLQDLAETRSGTFPQITFYELGQIDVDIPDINEQKIISEYIMNYDEKIENNKKINHHLLEQAIAIHKYFCVELVDDTFVTETVKSISNEVVTGKTPSTKIKEYYGGSLPFITIPDMHGNVFCVETARYLTNVGEQSQQRKTLPAKSIAVSCIATPGLVCLLDRPSQTNQQINSVIPKENQEYYLFLELLSKSQLIIELGSSGSTTYNLNKTQFEKIEILAPPIEKRGQINQMLSPLFDELNHIQHENNRLIELRDTLLPKLMSGELSVSQAAK